LIAELLQMAAPWNIETTNKVEDTKTVRNLISCDQQQLIYPYTWLDSLASGTATDLWMKMEFLVSLVVVYNPYLEIA